MAAQKAPSPAMEFLMDALKRDKRASYADLKAKADDKKLTIYPIMFGRAQAILGIVKSAKRGSKKAKTAATAGGARRGRPADPNSKSARIRALLGSGMSAGEIAKKVGATTALVYAVTSAAKSSGRSGGKRGPGRPRMSSSASSGGLGDILSAVKETEQSRLRLRAALERIQALIDGALAS